MQTRERDAEFKATLVTFEGDLMKAPYTWY